MGETGVKVYNTEFSEIFTWKREGLSVSISHVSLFFQDLQPSVHT